MSECYYTSYFCSAALELHTFRMVLEEAVGRYTASAELSICQACGNRWAPVIRTYDCVYKDEIYILTPLFLDKTGVTFHHRLEVNTI